VTRSSSGGLNTNLAFNINHLATLSVATHAVATYLEVTLDTFAVVQGTTAIAATSTNIICTAMTIDASASFPHGVALRGIRFAPVPGSQE
jgi:phage-related tail fiber protein